MHSTLLALSAVLLVAQAGQTPPDARNPTQRLTGCVSARRVAGGEFTFTDGASGTQYRLVGKDVKEFAGKRVEVVRAANRRFSIRGGLYPSPNVAAQAGAMDPAQAAIATQPGGGVVGTGAPMPELRVARLRAVTGGCD